MNPTASVSRIICAPLWIAFGLLAAAFNAVGAAPGDAPGLYLAPDPDSARIGEPLVIHLRSDDVFFDPDRVIDIGFELDPERWHLGADWQRDFTSGEPDRPAPWSARLQAFQWGDVPLPKTRVTYRDAEGDLRELLPTTRTVRIESVRPEEARGMIAQGVQAAGGDPLRAGFELIGRLPETIIFYRDRVPIGRAWWPLWLAVLILAVLAPAGWWLWRRYARRGEPLQQGPAQPVDTRPPGVWALEELDRRSASPACRSGPAKVVYTHVSEVVRLYLHRRYGIDAIDMTTLECLRALQGRRPSREVLGMVRDFLEKCDMVKFTKYEPPREDWASAWDEARMIVRRTSPPGELGDTQRMPDAPAGAARAARGDEA